MIRPCRECEFPVIAEIINDAADAYYGVIPDDRWKEPYMSEEELRQEMDAGVTFWGFDFSDRNGNDNQLIGVMGVQEVQDVTLIRHASVRSIYRGRGIGGKLLEAVLKMARKPVLIGTWSAAFWAIRFYEKHGFHPVMPNEKDRLLHRYWSIPDRQVELSVVLAQRDWAGSVLEERKAASA